jgi:hypothetical protein
MGMELPHLAILFFGIGVALLAGELLLPDAWPARRAGRRVDHRGHRHVLPHRLLARHRRVHRDDDRHALRRRDGGEDLPKTPIGRRVVLPPVVDGMPEADRAGRAEGW